MSCEMCIDPDGVSCVPYYGVGPHICFMQIPGATIGQSQPLPPEQWPANYREDPACPGMGVYWCPHCGEGKPVAQPANTDGVPGSPGSESTRPDQPKLPESGGGSSIGLGAEGEQ